MAWTRRSNQVVGSEVDEAEALHEAEEFVLCVAREWQPASLGELRSRIDEKNREQGLDASLLRVAVWSLLNAHRLQLSPDRRLRIGP